jgi:hypothetical protein
MMRGAPTCRNQKIEVVPVISVFGFKKQQVPRRKKNGFAASEEAYSLRHTPTARLLSLSPLRSYDFIAADAFG